LSELLEKEPDADLLRQMIQFVAQRMMQLNVDDLCGACFDVISLDRNNTRNGYAQCTSRSSNASATVGSLIQPCQ